MWRHLQRPHIKGVTQGCPNLPCFATFSACLELRPLSSAGITRLSRYYGPFRHPIAPFLTVTGLRLVVTTDHAIGLPVLRAFSLCTCCRYYPGTATDGNLAHPASRISLPQKGGRVGLCNVLFEDCSAFTRVTACTLALSPYVVTRFTGGFNRFVTSTVAPVASGWSDGRVGLPPTGKTPPYHGAHPKRTLAPASPVCTV